MKCDISQISCLSTLLGNQLNINTFLDHGRQLTKTINYYTQKINVAKSASGVLKSIGLNSPSNITTSSPSLKEKRNSIADSNTSNVSIGGVSTSTKEDSILVSPSKALFVHEDSKNDTPSNAQLSPSISIGEEALKIHHDRQSETNASKTYSSEKEPLNSIENKSDTKPQLKQQASNQQNFCDPLLRRESESETTTLNNMSKIKDMNISKVVEKCQSSM